MPPTYRKALTAAAALLCVAVCALTSSAAFGAVRLSKAKAQRSLVAYGKQLVINNDLPPVFSDGSGVTAAGCRRLSAIAFKCTLGFNFDDEDATHCDAPFKVNYATPSGGRLMFRKLARSDCYAQNMLVGS